MKKIILIATSSVFITFFALPESYAQRSTEIQNYRIGSNTVPGTDFWEFTYGEGFPRIIRVSVIKDINRYKLLFSSNAHLGDIEMVLNDNSSINFVRRSQYDHYLDGSLHSIYYLTESEISMLSSVDISHIVTQEDPGLHGPPRGNVPRYYRYMNRYQGIGQFGMTNMTNNTADAVRALLRHVNRSSSNTSTGTGSINCRCETVYTGGNRSYMCEPIPIYIDNNINLAIMMAESNDEKYLALNALMSGQPRKFDGPVSIDFDNGRSHTFAFENHQISRIGGRDVSQGLYKMIFTTERSIRSSNIRAITFRFENGDRRSYRVNRNRNALQDQYQCF